MGPEIWPDWSIGDPKMIFAGLMAPPMSLTLWKLNGSSIWLAIAVVRSVRYCPIEALSVLDVRKPECLQPRGIHGHIGAELARLRSCRTLKI